MTRPRDGAGRAIGLFCYGLIREAADPGLSTRARGRLVRAVAAAEHLDPTGRLVRVSRETLDRWIRAWRRGGFDAPVPGPREAAPWLLAEVMEIAVALKREDPWPGRGAGRRILATQTGWAPGEGNLHAGSPTTRDRRPDLGWGRRPGVGVEASARTSCGQATPCMGRTGRPQDLSVRVPRRPLAGDHGHVRVGEHVRLAAALRPALGSRGVPERIYVELFRGTYSQLVRLRYVAGSARWGC